MCAAPGVELKLRIPYPSRWPSGRRRYCVSRYWVRATICEPCPQSRCVQVPTDEHQLTCPPLRRTPRLPGTSIERHVDAVEHKAPGFSGDVDDALCPQQVLADRLHQLVDPAVEQSRVNRTVLADGDA